MSVYLDLLTQGQVAEAIMEVLIHGAGVWAWGFLVLIPVMAVWLWTEDNVVTFIVMAVLGGVVGNNLPGEVATFSYLLVALAIAGVITKLYISKK